MLTQKAVARTRRSATCRCLIFIRVKNTVCRSRVAMRQLGVSENPGCLFVAQLFQDRRFESVATVFYLRI